MVDNNKFLEMSDEEFIKLSEAQTGVDETSASVEAPTADPDPANPAPAEPAQVTEPTTQEPTVEAPAPVVPEPEKPAEPAAVATPEKPAEPVAPVSTDPANPAAPEAPAEPEKPIDYKALYEQVIAPIKANGKTIEVRTPEDAIRLMQMGAGFGRKMQDIQPHLKTLRFLENNGLLNVDQSELAFLVDLRNKNPDAIKKLVKDAGIDPLEMNIEEPVNYQTNIQPVTDKEIAFRETLENLRQREGGMQTIAVCNTEWDEKSQQALWNDPELFDVIHEHRQNGVYDTIKNEVDRLRAMGQIPMSAPFLSAYKQVGDYLRDNNVFAAAPAKEQPAAQPATPAAPATPPALIEQRVAVPKPSVANNDKAKAAALTQATPQKAAPIINPLALSDEEFEKQFGNRY